MDATAAGLTAPETGGDELVRDTRARADADRPEGRALLPFVISGGAVIMGAVVCALVLDTDLPGSGWRALFFLAFYALATRVEFEIGNGASVPSEVMLVPMLFLLPLGLVPAVCAAGIVVGAFADRPRALRNPLRALPSIASAAHVFGPVIVLSAANGLPLRWSAWPVYLGALAAQYGFDIVAAAVGTAFEGVSPLAVARHVTHAFAVDTALAPLGLALAFAALPHPYLVAISLPLVFLLRTFAAERSRRIDNALELRDAYRGTAFLLGVGSTLGLSPQDRRDAEFVAMLHDVGKIRVPKEILNKPGLLTPDKRAIGETHAAERWDGAGDPDRIAGEQIPLIDAFLLVVGEA